MRVDLPLLDSVHETGRLSSTLCIAGDELADYQAAKLSMSLIQYESLPHVRRVQGKNDDYSEYEDAAGKKQICQASQEARRRWEDIEGHYEHWWAFSSIYYIWVYGIDDAFVLEEMKLDLYRAEHPTCLAFDMIAKMAPMMEVEGMQEISEEQKDILIAAVRDSLAVGGNAWWKDGVYTNRDSRVHA